jgi:aryl sulfotransferase
MAARARAVGLADLEEMGPPPDLPEDPGERFWIWVDAAPETFIGPSLSDVLHHVETFWTRRDLPAVGLFHYSDMALDLPGQLRRLADLLDVEASDQAITRFAAAASFDNMKARADELAPESHNRIWHSNSDFFHRGTSGQWTDLVDSAGADRYERRVAELVSPEVAAWAHLGWAGVQPGVASVTT